MEDCACMRAEPRRKCRTPTADVVDSQHQPLHEVSKAATQSYLLQVFLHEWRLSGRYPPVGLVTPYVLQLPYLRHTLALVAEPLTREQRAGLAETKGLTCKCVPGRETEGVVAQIAAGKAQDPVQHGCALCSVHQLPQVQALCLDEQQEVEQSRMDVPVLVRSHLGHTRIKTALEGDLAMCCMS